MGETLYGIFVDILDSEMVISDIMYNFRARNNSLSVRMVKLRKISNLHAERGSLKQISHYLVLTLISDSYSVMNFRDCLKLGLFELS